MLERRLPSISRRGAETIDQSVEETRLDESLKALAGSGYRRDLLGSLGVAGVVLLTALGLGEATAKGSSNNNGSGKSKNGKGKKKSGKQKSQTGAEKKQIKNKNSSGSGATYVGGAGPAGPPGPTGPTGPQGPTGPANGPP